MKRTVILMLCVCMLLLAGCSANPRCEFDEINKALAEAQWVRCYVYEDESSYEIDGGAVATLISGEWEKCGRPDSFHKALSVTVGTQYEIGLFADGKAIVYCGYAGVFEKDRQYYSYSIESSMDDVAAYLRENGFRITDDEVHGSGEGKLYDAPGGNEIGVLSETGTAFRSGKRADGWCKLEYNGETVFALDADLTAKAE